MNYIINYDNEIYEFIFGKNRDSILSVVIRLSSKKQCYECPVSIIERVSFLPKCVKGYIYKCLGEYNKKINNTESELNRNTDII